MREASTERPLAAGTASLYIQPEARGGNGHRALGTGEVEIVALVPVSDGLARRTWHLSPGRRLHRQNSRQRLQQGTVYSGARALRDREHGATLVMAVLDACGCVGVQQSLRLPRRTCARELADGVEDKLMPIIVILLPTAI